MSDVEVTIKGVGDGLLVTLGPGLWDKVETAFLETILSQAIFSRAQKLPCKWEIEYWMAMTSVSSGID